MGIIYEVHRCNPEAPDTIGFGSIWQCPKCQKMFEYRPLGHGLYWTPLDPRDWNEQEKRPLTQQERMDRVISRMSIPTPLTTKQKIANFFGRI